MTVDAISTKTGLKGIQTVVNTMIERGIIIISEKLVERYRAKRENYVEPTFDRNGIPDAFEQVKGAKKQETLLLALIEMCHLQRPGEPRAEVSRAALLGRSGCTGTILLALVKKGLVNIYIRKR